MVRYLSKQTMNDRFGAYFGITVYAEKTIYIRNDLPNIVQKSVKAHEQKHLENGDLGSFWKNEPPAWWAGFKGQPFGFFLGIIMSITLSRIKLYWNLITGDKNGK